LAKSLILSRLRREIFQIYTNQTNLFWKIWKDFVRFLSRSDTHYQIFSTCETWV